MKKRKFQIKTILILFCVLILLVPVLGLVFGVKISYSHLANQKINEILDSKIRQNDTAVQNVMSKMAVVSGSIAINPEVVQYLRSESDRTGLLCSDALEQVELLLANSFDLPMNIMVFGEGKMLKTWIGKADSFDFEQQMTDVLNWYEEQNKSIFWFKNEEGIFDFYTKSGKKYLNLLRKVELKGTPGTFWIIASVDSEELSRLLFGSRQETAELYTLQDENGQMIMNLYPDAGRITEEESKKYVTRLEDKMYYHAEAGFSSYGTKMKSSMVMDSKKLMVDLNQLNIIFHCGVGAILIVFLAALLLFTRYLTRPISTLLKAMERTKDTQEYLPVNESTNIAEISVLYYWYNVMVESINDYINKIKYQEQEKRRLHFQMLQMQINPHFLFNSLNSIKWVCYMNQDEKAGDLIAALGRMYEISMNKGSLHLSLREEKEFIESYVRLMENRYDISVDFSFSLTSGLENIQLLKFILQPVVENIFLHGFQGISGNKEIRISTEIMKDKLHIWIKDNGTGICPEQMCKLQEEMKKTDREVTKVGIINVNHRIRIHYGEEYGLWISNREDIGQGTEVLLILPVRHGGECV
ncbi:MAG: histidine kinase [Faecalicatena sp.]|uniref:sensor histidine kinase n=1 Tax=Faecalicatena sp. TaxID=2005360 RepID=UPI00258E7542|nr:histidine kinase [Faecalicatena sp.]MCI6466577.1 histidine kinase [Faecalicatena sp.]MDY5617952.1 histidine kinase [Lachnospiraceae bacterium]